MSLENPGGLESLENLTEERLAQLRECTSAKEVLAMLAEDGLVLNDEQLEVLEFVAKKGSPCLEKPLSELALRDDTLIAAIIRKGACIIPNGSSEIYAGDRVLAATTRTGMTCLEDILRG